MLTAATAPGRASGPSLTGAWSTVNLARGCSSNRKLAARHPTGFRRTEGATAGGERPEVSELISTQIRIAIACLLFGIIEKELAGL